jgi:hypothetical protein
MPRLLVKSTKIAGCFALILIFSLVTVAQSAQGHFTRDGLSFDYPGGWLLNDRSDPKAQQLILTRPDISSLILVVAFRDAILTRAQLIAATQQTTEPYVRDLVAKLSSPKSPAKRDSSCTAIVDATVGGVLVRGEMNGAPATAEVYPFPKSRRFVNLIYVRKDAEESQSSAVWKLVRESLKVDAVDAGKVADPEMDLAVGSIYAGVLNGKAVSLPRPDRPSGDATGAVIVGVTIDETGKVIAAQAISGNVLLRGASEQAARKARFTPTTLCGKPVKVNGSIVYNFVRG